VDGAPVLRTARAPRGKVFGRVAFGSTLGLELAVGFDAPRGATHPQQGAATSDKLFFGISKCVPQRAPSATKWADARKEAVTRGTGVAMGVDAEVPLELTENLFMVGVLSVVPQGIHYAPGFRFTARQFRCRMTARGYC